MIDEQQQRQHRPRRRRWLAVGAMFVGGVVGGAGVASAYSTYTFKSTASPLAVYPAANNSSKGYVDHDDHWLTGCSTGTWTRSIWVWLSNGDIYNLYQSSTGCSGVFNYGPLVSTKAACTRYVTGNLYANCKENWQ